MSRKTGITRRKLLGKPKLTSVLVDLIQWINKITEQVNAKTMEQHYPGLCTVLEIQQTQVWKPTYTVNCAVADWAFLSQYISGSVDVKHTT